MYIRNPRPAVLVLGLASLMALCLGQGASAYTSGYWSCHQGGWSAYTTYRSMEGLTSFECGGICGDDSHNQPYSWVDFTGGISQSQQNTSDSFFGPFSGEWNGCASTGASQVSTGVKWIEGINQSWDRWPNAWWSSNYAGDMTSFSNYSSPMRTPYGSVYDLDCAPGWISWTWGGSCPKEVIGTIYWDNFPVTSRLIAGNPVPDVYGGYGYAKWELAGDTGVFCSTPANGCESVICSDLHVRNYFECTWIPVDENACTGGQTCQ